jgi:hypothetical protein
MTEDQIKRKLLWMPCKTKEDLHRWIKIYLGLDMPDGTVDPASNSSPMDVIWETYRAALDGREDYTQALAYSSRDSFKTLGAAVIELLMIVHCERSAAHMAAIESQAKKSQQYLKKFLNRPFLRDYVTSKNERTLEISRYRLLKDPSVVLAPAEWNALTQAQKDQYEEVKNYISIVICTIAGANCVSEDTNIRVYSSDQEDCIKPAKDVEAGDVVRSYNTKTGAWQWQVVEDVVSTQKPSMLVHFEDGSSVVLSEDHPLFSESGWMLARALRVGTKCMGDGGIAQANAPQQTHHKIQNPWSVICGSLLGDASMSWPKNKKREKYGIGPRFSVNHTSKKSGYLRVKQDALGLLGMESSIIDDAKGQQKLFSKVDSRLSGLYDMLYINGQKTVTREYLDRFIDEEALAYWFMDDGRGNAENVGSIKDHAFTIATCSFSMAENEEICNWLADRFGLKARVGRVSNSTGKTYPQIELDLDSSRKMATIIDQYVVPCMKYKMVTPEFFLGTRCIDCDEHIPLLNRSGFSRCPKHHRSLGRRDRAHQKTMKEVMTKVVKKLEFVGIQKLVDIVIDTKHNELRNFVGNGIVLHNSEHVPFMVVDELDVITNPDAYEESKFIPTITNGKPPITFLTSTRKYSFGIVQKEIDKARESGLQIRHWNIIDVTERCHPDRHLPEEDRVTIYYSEDLLKSVSKEEWELMSPDQQARFVKSEGYTGCLQNCRLFAVCKGRLADMVDRPYSDAKYNSDKRIMLKTIPHVITQFRKSSNEKAKAQLMCWKPSKEGLIYPSFDRDIHSLTPAQMASKITGEHYSPHLTKAQLVDIMQSRSLRFVCGQDYGFTHNFATVTAAVQGANCYVFDVISAPELELHQKIEICESKIKRFDPEIWADVAYPSDIKSFKRSGFRMREWSKAKDSVTGGIESVRSRLSPTMGEPQLFFLRDDDGCELLMRRMAEYHWKLDAANKPTDIPDDTDDDECDALRYLVMNVFSPKAQVAAPPEEHQAAKTKNWMSDQIRNLVGEDSPEFSGTKGRSGGFVWDL